MPKGDAEELRADLDDGHTRIANLMLEGLCCAPLSGAQYAVSLFIIRRTYGWAKQRDRDSGKMDAMTCDEIADGTGLSRSGVSKAISGLLRSNVILQEEVRPGNYMAYGMNPDVASWGTISREWRTCKQALRDAREGHRYNRNGSNPSTPNRRDFSPERDRPSNQKGIDLTPEQDRASTRTGERLHPNRVEVGALNPTGSGAQGTPTDNRQKGLQKGGQTATAPPAHSEQERTDGERPTALPATTRILTTICDDWQPAKLTAWLKAAGRSLQSTAARQVHLDDAALAAELQRTPPTGSSRGDWYVDKLIERLQRTPASRSGAPPEFIALEGECPEEEGGMQIWHYKLEKWLAQREQSAAG